MNHGDDLVGRQSKCSEGCPVLSSTEAYEHYRAFFEFRGEGSRDATDMCKVCHYALIAHDPTAPHMARLDKNGLSRYDNFMAREGAHDFTPAGPFEFDHHYDGCRGWD